MKKFNVAIIGAGNIANSMAKALKGISDEVNAYAVASRSLKKAEEFAKKWGFEKAYGSYEEMVLDPAVDLVYVATPHSHHFDHAKLCVENGKPAIVEKAFTGNARQARDLLGLAEEKGVLVTEAMWTRYQPSRHLIRGLIEEGMIGEPKEMKADFCQQLTHIQRLIDPKLAGGALLDLGIYSLTFASMYFGDDFCEVSSACDIYKTGVDREEDIIFTYPDGKKAYLRASLDSEHINHGTIIGTKGRIEVERISCPSSVTVYDADGNEVRSLEMPLIVNGYEYEILAAKRAILEGRLECEELPHAKTIQMMEIMDELRACWGIHYDFD